MDWYPIILRCPLTHSPSLYATASYLSRHSIHEPWTWVYLKGARDPARGKRSVQQSPGLPLDRLHDALDCFRGVAETKATQRLTTTFQLDSALKMLNVYGINLRNLKASLKNGDSSFINYWRGSWLLEAIIRQIVNKFYNNFYFNFNYLLYDQEVFTNSI